MADFNYKLNRQGPKGAPGDKGDQGFSPEITVDTNTAAEYKLKIVTETNTFVTDNLRGSAVDDQGGTYMRYDPETQAMYAGFADIATEEINGIVTLASDEDIEEGTPGKVVTADLLQDALETITGEIPDISNLATKSELSTEVTNRTNADTTLRQSISTEVSSRTQADSELSQRISTEVSQRTLADTSLQQSVSTLASQIPDVSGLATKSEVSTETSQRTQADTSLATSISTLATQIPSVGDGTITVVQNGTTAGSFNVNQDSDYTLSLIGGSSYDLPAATTTTLGGLIVGDNLTVDGNGRVSASTSLVTQTTLNTTLDDYSTKSDVTTALSEYPKSSTLATVATSGDYNDLINKPTVQTVTLATTTTPGIVQPDGTSVTIDNNGVISASGSAPTNMVTTDTDQYISGKKTMGAGTLQLGDKAINAYYTARGLNIKYQTGSNYGNNIPSGIFFGKDFSTGNNLCHIYSNGQSTELNIHVTPTFNEGVPTGLLKVTNTDVTFDGNSLISNNGTVNFNYGTTPIGSITMNQSTTSTITIPSSSYTAGNGLDIDNNEISIVQDETMTYHYTPVGSMTDNNGVLSNFSTSNYAKTIPADFSDYTSSANTWEMVWKFTFGQPTDTYYNETQVLYAQGVSWACMFGTEHYKPYMCISNSTEEASIGEIRGNTTLVVGNTYYYKAEFTGTAYNCYISTDGVNWTLEGSITSSTKISARGTWNIGYSYNEYGTQYTYVFQGSIDLNGCYIKTDGNFLWRGATGGGGIAKATSSLYGLVKPDGNTIIINDGVISSIGGGSNKISSTTISTIETLTQAEYDALVSGGTVDANTEYHITDAPINADINLSNVSDTGKIAISNFSMPGVEYDDLTLGASDTSYTAPSNGYYLLEKDGSAGQFFRFKNQTTGTRFTWAFPASITGSAIFPVAKGDTVQIDYSASGTTQRFRFIYAKGSESEAS